jgi:hypothetical protein
MASLPRRAGRDNGNMIAEQYFADEYEKTSPSLDLA